MDGDGLWSHVNLEVVRCLLIVCLLPGGAGSPPLSTIGQCQFIHTFKTSLPSSCPPMLCPILTFNKHSFFMPNPPPHMSHIRFLFLGHFETFVALNHNTGIVSSANQTVKPLLSSLTFEVRSSTLKMAIVYDFFVSFWLCFRIGFVFIFVIWLALSYLSQIWVQMKNRSVYCAIIFI